MKGCWTVWTDDEGGAWIVNAPHAGVPVVPCDDAAVERAVRALTPYAWHDKDAREIVEVVLRAAGDTP